jgi:hypothetical protein
MQPSSKAKSGASPEFAKNPDWGRIATLALGNGAKSISTLDFRTIPKC